VETSTSNQAHIAYELVEENDPKLVVITFLSRDLGGPTPARSLGEQLNSLIRPDLPREFVIDFGNVRFLGSTAFGELVAFVRKVGRVHVCNMDPTLRLGASLIGLDAFVWFAASRDKAIRAALRGVEDREDAPLFVS
jgi:anti-anti-sigma regulatory factor